MYPEKLSKITKIHFERKLQKYKKYDLSGLENP